MWVKRGFVLVVFLIAIVLLVHATPPGPTPVPGHTGAEIAPGTITQTQIANNAVGPNELQPNAVTNANIENGAISLAKLMPASCGTGTFAVGIGATGLQCATQSAGGGGTITSISAGAGILLTPNPITSTGAVAISPTYTQRRVSIPCAAGSSIRQINEDGTVLCEVNDTGAGGGVAGTGTTNMIAKWTSATTIGNSLITDTGTAVGIGTTTPTSLLHVMGAIDVGIAGRLENGGTNMFLRSIDGSVQQRVGVGDTVGGGTGFAVDGSSNSGTSWTTFFYVNTQGGNVGIGTTSPTQKLDVAGTVRMTGFQMLTGALAGAVLTSDAAGIGTWQQAGAGTIPSGAVMFFDLAACPAGWTELTTAQGRYVVGMPAGGTLGTPIGTQLGVNENRAAGQHTHTINDPSHYHSATVYIVPQPTGASAFAGTQGTYTQSGGATTTMSTTGIAINPNNAPAGTNAPYIYFRVCRKN